MNREDKLKALEEIKNGVPPHIALNRNKYMYLTRNESEEHYWTKDGQKVSKEEQEKYFPDSILCINVSKQFQYNENGKIVKINSQSSPPDN